MKTNFLKTFLSKIKKWYLALPDRKRHIELITAALSVPMMVTVIIVNLYSIKKNNNTTATITSAPIQVVVENPAPATASNINPPKDLTVKTTGNVTVVTPTTTPTSTPTPTPTSTSCKKDIGEIEILSPQDGEIITKDNICITISTDSNYCPVTFAYKLDNNDWSDYTSDDSLCLYNLTTGKKTLQIKVKSTAIDKSVTLQRTFTYQAVTPTPTTAPNSN